MTAEAAFARFLGNQTSNGNRTVLHQVKRNSSSCALAAGLQFLLMLLLTIICWIQSTGRCTVPIQSEPTKVPLKREESAKRG